MPNLNTELTKKFKSRKVNTQIKEIIGPFLGNVYVFVSSIDNLVYNTAYIEEFGHNYKIEEFEEEAVLILCLLNDTFKFVDLVDKSDIIMMLSKMKPLIDCLFIYANGTRKILQV